MDPRELEPKDFDSMDETMAEIYRGMTESQRLQVAFRLWESGRAMMEMFVRNEYPDWCEDEIQKETGRRMLRGTELTQTR